MIGDSKILLRKVRQEFQNLRVLVIGDLMLDRYLWGEVFRISPEAPVPIVKLTDNSFRGGGAANVAMNLANLGTKVFVAGFTGRDENRKYLLNLLKDKNIQCDAVLPLQRRPTITKTRIIGSHQQMLRLDEEEPGNVAEEAIRKLMGRVRKLLSQYQFDAIVLSDYNKGTLTEELCQEVIRLAHLQEIIVVVDPKGKNFSKYRRATTITPNLQELEIVTGIDRKNIGAMIEAGRQLLRQLEIDFLVLTRSEKGITLIEKKHVHHAPAKAKEVYDVSGAGDTVVATLTVALSSGLRRIEAIELANLAAGVVVGKVGTSPITIDELAYAIRSQRRGKLESKVMKLEDMQESIEDWRAHGEKVIVAPCNFNTLRAHHIRFLKALRTKADRLIVCFKQQERNERGHRVQKISTEEMAYIVSSLEVVDAVLIANKQEISTLVKRFPGVLNHYNGDSYQKLESA